MYICVCVLPARALYIDQLQHRRIVCWSISVAYALRKMLFLNDSPKLSWLWPGSTHTHTYIDTNKCTHVHRPARIWSTAAVQSGKWSNVPQCNSSRFECTQNAHDLSPCLDCKSLRSLEKSKHGHYLHICSMMYASAYLPIFHSLSLTHTVSRSALSIFFLRKLLVFIFGRRRHCRQGVASLPRIFVVYYTFFLFLISLY